MNEQRRKRLTRTFALLIAGLFVLSVIGFLAVSPVRAQIVFAPPDCAGTLSAGLSSTVGNNPTGFLVGQTGSAPGTIKYGVVIPSAADLIEYCVYTNGGNVGTVTTGSGNCPVLSSQNAATSTLISACSPDPAVPSNWKAGFNCGSYTCVAAERLQGTQTLVGPLKTFVLDVTYTGAVAPVDNSNGCTTSGGTCIILHVSDEGNGNCGPGGTPTKALTCFILPPFTPTFPPPPPPSVPQFPLGMGLVVIALTPVLFFMKKRISPVN